MLDDLRSHHLTHICTSGWVTYHTGSAADQGDRLISCHLETFHQAQCHEMSYMKAVSGWVKTDVENCLSFVYHFTDFFFICYLGDQASGN